jgi:hypothetical protein
MAIVEARMPPPPEPKPPYVRVDEPDEVWVEATVVSLAEQRYPESVEAVIRVGSQVFSVEVQAWDCFLAGIHEGSSYDFNLHFECDSSFKVRQVPSGTPDSLEREPEMTDGWYRLVAVVVKAIDPPYGWLMRGVGGLSFRMGTVLDVKPGDRVEAVGMFTVYVDEDDPAW